MRRGFTLIELSFVLAVMGVLFALSVPTYRFMVARARSEEARGMVSTIAQAELQYRRDHHRFLACAPDGGIPKQPVPFPNALDCWRALGIQVDGPVRYRYQVALTPDAFQAIAEGDLDGNGRSSLFTLDGRNLQLSVKDELE